MFHTCRFTAPMIIEIVSKCFCGIEIPNAKQDGNHFVTNMKVALMHDPPLENWMWYVPSKKKNYILSNRITGFIVKSRQ